MFRQTSPAVGRQQIIDLFLVRAKPAEREGLRKILERMTKEELEQAHEALQAHVQLQNAEEELARITVESEADRIWHEESMRLAREPRRKAEEKAQLEADRKTFTQAAKSLQSFGVNEGNFSLIRQMHGPGFSIYDIQQGISSNALQLSPATQAELSEWDRAAKEAEILRLKSMDLISLRKLVREEGARIVGQQPAPDETQRVRAAERNDGAQYPPLPDEYRDGDGPEQVLNAQFIKTCSAATLKRLIQRYGSAQIDEVLRGETRTGEVWKY